MKATNLRLYFLSILSLALALSLTACDSADRMAESSEKTAQATATNAPEVTKELKEANKTLKESVEAQKNMPVQDLVQTAKRIGKYYSSAAELSIIDKDTHKPDSYFDLLLPAQVLAFLREDYPQKDIAIAEARDFARFLPRDAKQWDRAMDSITKTIQSENLESPKKEQVQLLSAALDERHEEIVRDLKRKNQQSIGGGILLGAATGTLASIWTYRHQRTEVGSPPKPYRKCASCLASALLPTLLGAGLGYYFSGPAGSQSQKPLLERLNWSAADLKQKEKKN